MQRLNLILTASGFEKVQFSLFPAFFFFFFFFFFCLQSPFGYSARRNWEFDLKDFHSRN